MVDVTLHCTSSSHTDHNRLRMLLHTGVRWSVRHCMSRAHTSALDEDVMHSSVSAAECKDSHSYLSSTLFISAPPGGIGHICILDSYETLVCHMVVQLWDLGLPHGGTAVWTWSATAMRVKILACHTVCRPVQLWDPGLPHDGTAMKVESLCLPQLWDLRPWSTTRCVVQLWDPGLPYSLLLFNKKEMWSVKRNFYL